MNPIDIKVRKQVYDDFPNYYDHVPNDDYQVLGYDGAGVIESIGSFRGHPFVTTAMLSTKSWTSFL